MEFYPLIGCALLGAGTVALLIPVITRLARRYDVGRSRDFHHTHQEPVPRFGGLALAVAFVAVEGLIITLIPDRRASIPGRLVVILSSLAMFTIGFWDDLQPLGARRKLVGQVLVAGLVYYAGVGIDSFTLPFTGHTIHFGGWGVVVTVLWLVGVTNLLNLIDGVDGLAGGIALMLMGLLVFVGYQNNTFMFLTAGMTGALAAFLFFNFPPARIYLGDGGAYLLGFQIAVFSLVGSHKGTVVAALIAPLLVLALPIVDTLFAILRRWMRGLPLFRPDRRHIHHRLLAAGKSRRSVVLLLYGVTLAFLLMGFAAFWSRGQMVPVLLGVAVVLLLLCAGQLSFTREWLTVGRALGNSLATRQEVQYALSLSNWLRFEGERCGSLEELFEDLVFAGRRLGFTTIELRLADGKRVWSQSASCADPEGFRQEVQCGEFGVLALEAPGCMTPGACMATDADAGLRKRCPAETNTSLCEIMAELLAESWVKAAGRSGATMPLRFASRLAQVNGRPRRANKSGLARQLAASTRAEGLPLGRDSATA